MKNCWRIKPSKLSGAIKIPPSKSHTIRAFIVATLAQADNAQTQAVSIIRQPLMSGDGASALQAAKAFGAKVDVRGNDVYVTGISDFNVGNDAVDMGNSGTGLNLFASVAALGSRPRTFDGDASLRTRPVKSLLDALCELGATVKYHGENNQEVPFTIHGPIAGGRTTVNGISSQYVSSLLFACPLAPRDTHITVVDLFEHPYVEMTLWWLARQGIEVESSNELTTFKIRGGQKYKPFDLTIPADFSSSAFGAVAAAATRSEVTLTGLDFTDPQGDKAIFDHLETMGATVVRNGEAGVTVSAPNGLHGAVIDLNATPDALPALSIAAACASGETVFTNVEQARIKETDRIAVMSQELRKLNIDTRELTDGLVIKGGKICGARVLSHHDHRVAMALAVAGMCADDDSVTIIEDVDAADVTYPTYADDFISLGAKIEVGSF